MISAQVPENDFERVEAVKEYERLGDEEKAALQDIADLASEICDTPIALVTFITKEEQLVKVSRGYDGGNTSRDVAFCAHTILQSEVFQVKDALLDERFHDNPLVTDEPNIRFYAGTPLETEQGYNLGALCVIDQEPKELTDSQKNALQILSEQIMKRLELSKAKRELEEQNTALQQVSELRTRLLNVLAHDIRGPLASIRAVMDLISDGGLTQEEIDEFQSSVEVVMDQTEVLLENVLDWGKLEATSSKKDTECVDLAEEVSDVVDLSSIQAGLKKVNVTERVLVEGERKIHRDIFRLTLRNLLANAIKFSEDTSVEVEVTEVNDRIKLSVIDHGEGMNQQKADLILSGQIQSGTRGTMGEKGSGLGLSFVMEMLAKIGGEMKIDINEDGGTTFQVFFPTS